MQHIMTMLFTRQQIKNKVKINGKKREEKKSETNLRQIDTMISMMTKLTPARRRCETVFKIFIGINVYRITINIYILSYQCASVQTLWIYIFEYTKLIF